MNIDNPYAIALERCQHWIATLDSFLWSTVRRDGYTDYITWYWLLRQPRGGNELASPLQVPQRTPVKPGSYLYRILDKLNIDRDLIDGPAALTYHVEPHLGRLAGVEVGILRGGKHTKWKDVRFWNVVKVGRFATNG